MERLGSFGELEGQQGRGLDVEAAFDLVLAGGRADELLVVRELVAVDRAFTLLVDQFQIAEIDDALVLQCHLGIVQDDAVEFVAVVHVADAQVKRLRALLDRGFHVQAGNVRVAGVVHGQLDLGLEVVVKGLQFLVRDAFATGHEFQPGIENPVPVVRVPATGLDVLVRIDEGDDPAIEDPGHQLLLHGPIVDLLVADLGVCQSQFHGGHEVGLELCARIVFGEPVVEVVVEVGQLALRPDLVGARRVGRRKIGAERDAVRVADHGVSGNVPRRLEVFLHHHGRHGHALGIVVEALAAHAVAGEVARRFEVHVGEVADGVVVLGLVQASQRRLAGILDGVVVEVVDGPANPGDQLVDFVLGWPGLLILRRHDARFHLIDDAEPFLQVDEDILLGTVVVEVQAALAFLPRMAVVAVLLQDGLDLGVILLEAGAQRRL